jgi:hypothetical protein
MSIVLEAYRVATIAARENGDTLPTIRDLTALLRRWAYVGSREDVIEAAKLAGLKLADMPHEAKPVRARPVVL